MECAGVYDRKYQEFYYDGNSGCMTAKKLWEDSRKESNRSNVKITNINCTCCTTYKTWAQKHTLDAQKLKEQAKIPIHYRVYAGKTVKVVVDEKEVALYILILFIQSTVVEMLFQMVATLINAYIAIV